MSRKSRRSRSRQPVRSRRAAEVPKASVRPVAAVELPVTTSVSATPAPRPAPKAVTAGAQYHYVAGELRRIGILASIMLAILVVLVIILS